MGRVKQELTEPWGVLVGGVAAGVAWAVGIPVAAAAGVGVVVWAVKSAVSALSSKPRDDEPQLLPVKSRSAEEAWLRRAEKAVASFNDIAHSSRSGPIADKVRRIGEEATTTLAAMRRLAGQCSAVGIALQRIDAPRLAQEHAHLQKNIRHSTNAKVKAELLRSLEAVDEQRQVHDRLLEARSTLLARMQSTAINLEGLVARIAEVTALSETRLAGTLETQRIDELADEMEGLRLGIAETESLSERVLSAAQPLGGTVTSQPQQADLPLAPVHKKKG